jgi:hypothetical protein
MDGYRIKGAGEIRLKGVGPGRRQLSIGVSCLSTALSASCRLPSSLK